MSCLSISFRREGNGFTLLELLTALTLLAAILLVIFSITQQTGNAWKSARAQVDAFQAGRLAFEAVTRTLGHATLNTYYDYFDSGGRSRRDSGYGSVDHYGRQSDLHFISGKTLVTSQVTHSVFFQTTAGYANADSYRNMPTLLNSCGFYIVCGQDILRPAFLDSLPNAPANPVRYRLMQFLQPSENLQVYAATSGTSWFTQPLTGSSPPVQQLADNVIALVLLPRKSTADAASSATSLASNYEYDSRAASSTSTQFATQNQLPPLVETVLVVVDEPACKRLESQGTAIASLQASLFQQSEKLDSDVSTLESELIREHLNYRVFRTVVVLRNSKWTN